MTTCHVALQDECGFAAANLAPACTDRSLRRHKTPRRSQQRLAMPRSIAGVNCRSRDTTANGEYVEFAWRQVLLARPLLLLQNLLTEIPAFEDIRIATRQSQRSSCNACRTRAFIAAVAAVPAGDDAGVRRFARQQRQRRHAAPSAVWQNRRQRYARRFYRRRSAVRPAEGRSSAKPVLHEQVVRRSGVST